MDTLTIAGRSFRSRLMLGTGKYRSPQVMAECHRVSGAEIITVAVRRVRLRDGREDSILQHLEVHSYFLLPNTAGCRTAEQAVRTAHLAREAGFSHWIKLEVIGDDHTLFPDNEGLLQATRILVKDGFVALPYTTDDLPVFRLQLFKNIRVDTQIEVLPMRDNKTAYPLARHDMP